MVSTRKGISGLLNLFVVGVQGRFNEDDGIEAARAMWVDLFNLVRGQGAAKKGLLPVAGLQRSA